jgi:cytochrome c oxidase cbb3-type subunit 1
LERRFPHDGRDQIRGSAQCAQRNHPIRPAKQADGLPIARPQSRPPLAKTRPARGSASLIFISRRTNAMNTVTTEQQPWRFDLALFPVIIALSFFAGIFEAARSPDPRMVMQGWTFAAAMLAIGIWYLVRYGARVPDDEKGGYANDVVKAGVIASMFWGIAGMLVGVIIALQLSFPNLFYFPDLPWTNFGRMRPLHTSAVIFAFGGNVLIATSFYVVQRTSKARLFGGSMPWFVFWGYNVFILLAGTGYLEGITESREYAEPEWYVDIWLTLVWVCYLITFLGTLIKRKEPHIYVANWFYLSFIVTIAMLHIVNNLSLPVSIWETKSFSLFSGVQDALTQWWYGHNAVGFFLTAGFLGIMYYFIPKRVERPIYSYRLSIVHFWSLIFIYIWAGPHHLLFTALPEWTQTLGMTFSIILWMPSWGGMINGLMTLSGAWDKLRTDPVVRMLVVSVAFYGMSTFEGPVMSIKTVNALSHYTNWTIGHVHSGALGWVGYVSFGALYCLVPWLWKKQRLYSLALVEWHFWISTLGIVLYITSLWVAGIMQGLMWRAYNDFGFLEYSFVESVQAMHPYYIIRALGGLLYLTGVLIMAYNLWRTVRSAPQISAAAQPQLAMEAVS